MASVGGGREEMFEIMRPMKQEQQVQRGELLKQTIMLKFYIYICRFSIILAYYCRSVL